MIVEKITGCLLKYEVFKLSHFRGIWWTNASPGATRDENRVRHICNFFFIYFKANLSKCGSYSHVLAYSQTPFIHIIRFKIFTKIHIQILDLIQKKYMLKRIFASERIFMVIIHFKIFVLKWIYAKFGKVPIEANIC
jgi:hypothetical protein